MSGDEYLSGILQQYRTAAGEVPRRVGVALLPIVRDWAGDSLLRILYSGSYAKGTAIRGDTDVDFLISLRSTTSRTLREIYESLFANLESRAFSPRRQNVSIRIGYQGASVDLVPARLHHGASGDHSLYRRRTGTWTQTNIDTHIKIVRGSGRQNEIRAVKIWRQLNRLQFPSFYLELTVIEALKGRPIGKQLAQNVFYALQYIANNLETARVDDPANSANIISEDLTVAEKRSVAATARASRVKPNWAQVIW